MIVKLTASQVAMLSRCCKSPWDVWGGKRPIGGAYKNLRLLQDLGYLNGSGITPTGRAALAAAKGAGE